MSKVNEHLCWCGHKFKWSVSRSDEEKIANKLEKIVDATPYPAKYEGDSRVLVNVVCPKCGRNSTHFE
jgi:hypothetical protein